MSIEASECYVDWKQAELNGFSYCFHRMDGGLCGRSDSWVGHRETDSPVYHPFVKISTVFSKLNAAEWARDQIAKHAVRLEDEIRELRAKQAIDQSQCDAMTSEAGKMALEIRELREDKDRLDFVLGHCLPIELWFSGDEMVTVESREEIDAAMEEEARTR